MKAFMVHDRARREAEKASRDRKATPGTRAAARVRAVERTVRYHAAVAAFWAAWRAR
jgi:hypothetical protein